ncbi:hypothetical protein Tco_0681562 [Tanacetum coccineum]|uniref:Uncharacterized protein n=1 Tax=Tanacetum coccineum TaxID=301880 RepID=A0ABQ4XPZ4_9ASTR
MVNKIFEEGRREQDEIDAFKKEFRITNELPPKKNNSFANSGFEREDTRIPDNLKKNACPSNRTSYDRCIQQKDNSQGWGRGDIDEADSEGRRERSDFEKSKRRIKISDTAYSVSQET